MTMRQHSTRLIDWDLAKRLYQQGEPFSRISKAIGANPSTVCRKAQRYGWERASKVLNDVVGVNPRDVGLQRSDNELPMALRNTDNPLPKRAHNVDGDSENRRERVREQIRADVERVLDALDAIEPHMLTTSQLLLREKTAEVVLKRANAVFDMEKENKPIINIAVMAQLPNEVAIAATIDEG